MSLRDFPLMFKADALWCLMELMVLVAVISTWMFVDRLASLTRDASRNCMSWLSLTASTMRTTFVFSEADLRMAASRTDSIFISSSRFFLGHGPKSELELHLESLFAVLFISQRRHLVRSRGKICLEDWLSGPSHVSEHALPKVPSQKVVRDMIWVVWLPADRIKDPSVDLPLVRYKRDDFISVLSCVNKSATGIWSLEYVRPG